MSHRPLAIAAIILGMLSITVGASLAQRLFDQLGPGGVTLIRVGFAAVILILLRRPWRVTLPPGAWRWIIGYGLVLGLMNLCFYQSLKTIPLGIAIAIEFCGPLAVALSGMRHRSDLIWVVLACMGLGLLTPLTGAALDPVGVGFALAAGVCWAAYILIGQAAGHVPAAAVTAWGMSVAALVALPIGVFQAGAALLDLSILPYGLAVAVLSSALPYTTEMYAMRRLSRLLFGILMSIEPAIGAMVGLLMLDQILTMQQVAAIGCIIAASAGATLFHKPAVAHDD